MAYLYCKEHGINKLDQFNNDDYYKVTVGNLNDFFVCDSCNKRLIPNETGYLLSFQKNDYPASQFFNLPVETFENIKN